MTTLRTTQVTGEYYITITQSPVSIVIDVATEPHGGYITALKRLDMETLELCPALVDFNVRFASRVPDRMDEVFDWIKTATTIAQSLDVRIKERTDFMRPVKVKKTGFLAQIEFEEEEECNCSE